MQVADVATSPYPVLRKEDSPHISARLTFLDALRGWDMFWIIGADRVIRSLAEQSDNPLMSGLAAQFEHVDWEGLHFYDLIFPLFLFQIGVSIPYSFQKRLASGESKGSLYRHVAARVLIMVFFGMMITGNLLQYNWAKLDISYSVLQVLAIGYAVASVVYLNLGHRRQVVVTAAC